MSDYEHREYLSVGEVAAFTELPVQTLHRLVHSGEIKAAKSAGGQYRFRLKDVRRLQTQAQLHNKAAADANKGAFQININGTVQTMWCGDARRMAALADESVHLALTSPPYFNAKMYSEALAGDLGNVHNLKDWLEQTGEVWREVYRALQPGRKFFLNIMNLPVRENKSFRAINLTGKSVDVCEQIGFVFKRDIVWHKTNGVRAHFGTYPYPGGILLNNMHEFILEFEKPGRPGRKKYAHVSKAQKEASKLDKGLWLSMKNSDVWLIKPEKSGAKREHAAPFPVELPMRLIRAYSYVGETVLDPFAGSGTALLAAAQAGRHGAGYELNPAFCQTAHRRLMAHGKGN